MAITPDPLDLLAFIESGMSMTPEKIAERWPEWSKMKAAAMARYERDTREYRALHHRTSLTCTTDPHVNSISGAYHHWVYLPLIRAALGVAT